MDPLSVVDALTSASKAQGASAVGRVVSSFGNELTQLIAATLTGPASPTLGTKVDVKA